MKSKGFLYLKAVYFVSQNLKNKILRWPGLQNGNAPATMPLFTVGWGPGFIQMAN